MYVGLKIFGFIGIFVLPIVLLAVKGFYEKKSDGAADMPGPDSPGKTGGAGGAVSPEVEDETPEP
jgi:hypothetical protein